LCKSLVIKAKEVAKGDAKTFESRRKAVVEWIKSLKIEPKRVWNAIGISGEADISVEVLLLLAGLKTAIEEGDCTIDETFPKPETEQTGSTADRIKNHFSDTDKKVETEDLKPEPKKGKGKKKDAPKPEPETDESIPDSPGLPSEPEPKEEVLLDKWKCLRCDRKLKDNGTDVKGGKCAYCFGEIATL
jgi:hypothetical protein